MSVRLFDLNIEEILDNWEVHHAIREIIANALDEQILSKSAEVKIYRDHNGWHVRDYGRGIRIEDFTLNENKEKTEYPSQIIGKFGVGLKDALATFNRHGVRVKIVSPHGIFTLKNASKHGFQQITTLHVEYDDTPQDIRGTDVILQGIKSRDMERAQNLFLKFSSEEVIETTPYGDIIRRKDYQPARVYINGVLASEEENFLFSYNITSLTEGMKKRLNRERLNVGRSTYTERVKNILKSARSDEVRDALAGQVSLRATGDQCDEMQWLEISQLAMNILNEKSSVAFVTQQEIFENPNLIDNIREDGIGLVVISEAQKQKLDEQIKSGGPPVRTLDTYAREYEDSFKYEFVPIDQLSQDETEVYAITPMLFSLAGINDTRKAPPVLISETMRITQDDTQGVWDSSSGRIVIKRSQLASKSAYAGTLLHELVHATTGTSDVTRSFEIELTRLLGKIAVQAIS